MNLVFFLHCFLNFYFQNYYSNHYSNQFLLLLLLLESSRKVAEHRWLNKNNRWISWQLNVGLVALHVKYSCQICKEEKKCMTSRKKRKEVLIVFKFFFFIYIFIPKLFFLIIKIKKRQKTIYSIDINFLFTPLYTYLAVRLDKSINKCDNCTWSTICKLCSNT